MRITKLQHSRKQTPSHTRASGQVCTRIRNIDRVTRASTRQFHSFPACRLLPPLLLQPQLHPASIVAVLNAAKFNCLMQKFPRSSQRRYALALYRRFAKRNLRPLIRPLQPTTRQSIFEDNARFASRFPGIRRILTKRFL